MHRVELSIFYDSARAGRLVADAIAPEIGEIDGDRTTASVTRDGRTVSVSIDATDLVALRAGLNTWGTLLEVAERTHDVGTRRRDESSTAET